MKTVYYFGKDLSIYESLESLSKIKKSFLIKRINNEKKKSLKDSILIIDDSFQGFLKLIKTYPDKKNNMIVTTKKENINLNSLQNLRFFVKPIKVLDLYKEILKKIKNTYNNLDFSVNQVESIVTDKRGRKLKLTEKELKLFVALFNNYGKALNKKNLLYDVWGIHLEKVDSLNTRVLETLISRIRQKIVSARIDIKIIKNKSGYILTSVIN
tara:strand:+ start:226 stop:861 length:636 start_codon:yes stop_codon:yes gene_type:complete